MAEETTAVDPWKDDDRYYFTSSIEGDGFTVDVSITVTGKEIGPDVLEVSEHAQMVASRVAFLGRGRVDQRNPVPFTTPREVSF